MKSSGPVFTRQNPFKPASKVGKAHYHPSQNQSLSKKQKKTTLSPVRSNQRQSQQSHTLSQESQQPLPVTDEEPIFAESWPSSDSGSSPANTSKSSDVEMPKPSARMERKERKSVSLEPEVQQDSVLAEYIERFRRGRPQSREERRRIDSASREEQVPFWWMSPSSLPSSSTPPKTTDNDVMQLLKDNHGLAIFGPAGQHQRDRSLSPCRRSLSILSDTSHGESDDTEILQLQERANRLLLREHDDHECTLTDGYIHVSSEGLGCSNFSSPVSIDEPLGKPLIPSIIPPNTVMSRSDTVQKSSVIPPLVLPTRPEEDILFQWRLRRKIEQAREWPQSLQHSRLHGPTFSWQGPGVGHPAAASGPACKQHIQSTQPPEFSQRSTHPHIAAPQPETKEPQASCSTASGPPSLPAFVVSASSAPQPQTTAHVPAHMHFLCDVLPCPNQSSHASRQQSTDESNTRVVRKKAQVPGNSSIICSDEPVREHIPSPPQDTSGAEGGKGPIQYTRPVKNIEKVQTKESERRTAGSYRKQKKSRYTVDREYADVPDSTSKSSSHQRFPKKAMQQQRGSQEVSRERCTDDYATPPSPIHTALGEVVSEVLFPAADSSPAQRTPVSSVSPPCVSSAPPQISVTSCDAQDSMQVISQLLQEAEDSDGKEFEDDPLLQVLRKQRTWVKEQISEVDSMLVDLQDEQRVTQTFARST